MHTAPPPLPEWEIYVGNVFLYIVGPGPTAMRRCSRRNVGFLATVIP